MTQPASDAAGDPTASAEQEPPHGRRPALSWRNVWLLTALTAAIYLTYALARWRQFLVAGYDLGIFDQAVRRYAHFEAPLVALKGDHYNILGDHFHPLLAVLAPLYWIWDDPRMLIIAQVLLVCSTIPLLAPIVRRRIGNGWLPLVLLACYGLSWPVQRMVDYDVHEIALAMPLLVVLLGSLEPRPDLPGRPWRRDVALVLACAGLLLVREDMGMVVMIAGVLRLFIAGRRWLGVVLIAAGVATFVLVTMVVLPHFANDGQFAYWSYDALGPDAGSALRFMLAHPLRTLQLFFSPWVKTETMLYLFGPLLLLPLGSRYVLLTLPLLAQRFLSSRSQLWTTEYHYSAPIMVILFVAMIDTLSRIRGHWTLRGRRLARRTVLGWTMVVIAALMPVIDLANSHSSFPLIRLLGPTWTIDQHVRDQRAAVAAIPPGVCVEADDRIAIRLTRSNRVTLPTQTSGQRDLLVLDLSQEAPGWQLPPPAQLEQQALAQGFTVTWRQGSIVILTSPSYSGPSAACSPTAP